MFTRFLKTTAIAVLALSGAVAAAHAAGPVSVIQASSPVYWGANGDHAELMLRYSSHAPLTLTVNSADVFDIGTGVSNAGVQSCGTPIVTGQIVTSHQISPGGLCDFRATRSQSEVLGRFLLSDGTTTPANINTYVHASLEIRDVNDNVLTHIELR